MKDRPKFRLADEESKDVRATLPQAYFRGVLLFPSGARQATKS